MALGYVSELGPMNEMKNFLSKHLYENIASTLMPESDLFYHIWVLGSQERFLNSWERKDWG